MVFGVYTSGRLGNMLFQTAAAYSLSKDAIMYVSNPDQLKFIRKYEHTILRNIKIITENPPPSKQFIQSSFKYEKIVYENDEDISLFGSFQSEKFIDEKVIRKLFEIDEETKIYIEEKYGHLFKEEITSICVRRGDYLNYPHKWIFCGKAYYMKAIKHIGKNKRFLVNSDDIEWCKSVFKGSNFYFSEKNTPIVDLYLQSYCTNNIISNGTFCWWGAWLNSNPNKIVVAPKKWFGIAFKLDTSDLLPSSYILINNNNYFVRYIMGSIKIIEEKLINSLQKSVLRPYLKKLRNIIKN